MKKTKTIKLISLLVLSVFATQFLCGCSSLFLKKDTLVLVNGDKTSESKTGLTAQLKITDYSEIYSGTLLDYYPEGALALCVEREKSPLDATLSYSLIYYDGNNASQKTLSSIPVTEGRIDHYTGNIYYRESNMTTLRSSLYMVDGSRNTKVKITEDIPSSLLAWTLAEDGTLIYSSGDGIYVYSSGASSKVASLDDKSSVKKIQYLKSRGAVLMIISGSQGSNILYYMDDVKYEMNAVDVNVIDFSAEDNSPLVAYIKTSAAGAKQLYTYGLDNSARKLLFSGDMEKISLSPNGSYIAYVTEMTAQNSTQSVWLVNSNNDVPIQLTANTAISGGRLFWDSAETRILFSTSQSVSADAAPMYITHQITFALEYLKEK